MTNFDSISRKLGNKNLYWRSRYQEICNLRAVLKTREINESERRQYEQIISEQLAVLNNYSFYVIEKKTKSTFNLPVPLFYSNEPVININNFISKEDKFMNKFLFTDNEANYIIEKLNNYNKGNTYIFTMQKVKLL